MSRPEWIEELADAQDEAARVKLLDRLAPTLDLPALQLLFEEVGVQARVDLAEAERLALAGQELARRRGGKPVEALSGRALANVRYLQGRYREAVELYDRALALLRDEELPLEVAITLNSSLQARGYLGRYEQAFEHAAEAGAIFEAQGDRLRLARLKSNEANLFYRQDLMEEALERYRGALEFFRAEGGSAQDVAASLYNIATCGITLGRFELALGVYEELLEHCRVNQMPLVAARARYNVAYLHYLRGEYMLAIDLYEATRRHCEEAGDPYHLALCDLDQSEIYLELNLNEEALRLAQSAFAAFDGLGAGYEGAKALAFLAIAVSREGKAFESLGLFERARKKFEQENNKVWMALVDLYRALIFEQEGRLHEARSLARKALDFFQGSALTDKMVLSDLLLARVERGLGRLDAAEARCREALDGLEAIDQPGLGYKAYLVLGSILEEAGRPEEAIKAYRQAVGFLETLRGQLRGEELKISFFQDKLEVYESLTWLLLDGEPSAEDAAEAFRHIEQAKSRSLADMISFGAHRLTSTGGQSHLVEQMSNLRRELNWYYRQIDLQELRFTDESLRGPGVDPARERVSELKARSREFEDRLRRTLNDLRTLDSDYGSLQAPLSFSLDEVRAHLSPGQRLVELFEARGRIYGCVVGPDELRVRFLTSSTKLGELQRLLRFQMSKFRLGDDYVERFKEAIEAGTRAHFRALYDELLRPLEADLAAADHLILVPHGSLHYLPFHALDDGDRHLIDRFSISYAPSASVFAICAAKAPVTGGASLVLGVPDELTPQIPEEVRAVAAELPNAQVFLGEEATLERLRQAGAGAEVVHIATHGLFRKDNPMFSAIELGDSRLTMFDLYTLGLDAGLVVLSGCGTGLNVVEKGDELLGLTRGLLYAGARSLLVSLWDVNDRSTAEFMADFYRALKKTSSRAEALRSAMRSQRERTPHPYYWAPFVLVGQP